MTFTEHVQSFTGKTIKRIELQSLNADGMGMKLLMIEFTDDSSVVATIDNLDLNFANRSFLRWNTGEALKAFLEVNRHER